MHKNILEEHWLSLLFIFSNIALGVALFLTVTNSTKSIKNEGIDGIYFKSGAITKEESRSLFDNQELLLSTKDYFFIPYQVDQFKTLETFTLKMRSPVNISVLKSTGGFCGENNITANSIFSLNCNVSSIFKENQKTEPIHYFFIKIPDNGKVEQVDVLTDGRKISTCFPVGEEKRMKCESIKSEIIPLP